MTDFWDVMNYIIINRKFEHHEPVGKSLDFFELSVYTSCYFRGETSDYGKYRSFLSCNK